jgi:glycosyltransferase involved in cell wall biosynthesis
VQRRPVKRLSVVIANHNYAQYVGEAIDSALGMDWDDIEVVVVDDGSTDGSREVLAGYGPRITAEYTANGGQRAAVNRGFALSTGDVVVVLDADDVLPTDLPRRLDAVLRPSVAKVQFRMQRIDAAGRTLGEPFPAYRPVPGPADIRRWVTRTSAYPTPPGSGNAYARWFLDLVLPAGPELGRAADSALLAAAPFAGEVLTVPEVLVGYRRHDANDSDVRSDPTRFVREIDRAVDRWRFTRPFRDPQERDDAALYRSREVLQFRVAASRLTPDRHSTLADSRWRRWRDVLRSPLHAGPEPVAARLLIAGWSAAVLLAPRALLPRLLRLRYGRWQ